MISTAPPSFAQMAQEARKRAGMSLKQLSVAIGHDASFLSRLENGSRTPELPFVIRLATILGIDPTTLLLAAVRDQLPEDLQGYVPNPAGAPGFDAVRDHQAQLFEFELARLAVSAVVGANRFHVERTFEDCRPRPNGGQEIRQMILKEPLAGASPTRFSVRSVPPGVEFNFHTEHDGNKLLHRFEFPQGWKRTPEQKVGFTLDVTSEVPVCSGPCGVFRVPIVDRLDALKVSVELPRGAAPPRWDTHCSVTGGVGTDHKLKFACRDWKLEKKEERAELTVVEPLAGFCYGICWNPGGRDSIEVSPLPVTLSSSSSS